MTVATAPKRKANSKRVAFETADELLHSLGGIPAHRVRLDPPPGTATEKDVLFHLESADKRIYELIDGTLVEKAMGMRESFLAGFLIQVIRTFAQEHQLGLVSVPDGPFRMLSRNVRYPDVSYISWKKIPGDDIPEDKIWSIPPDLAIEVLSESNTVAEIERKVSELFRLGCRLIWVIDPDLREAVVHTSPTRRTRMGVDGVLGGGNVLPGFRLPLADVFNSTKKPKKKR